VHPYQVEILALSAYVTVAGFYTIIINCNGSLTMQVLALSTSAFWCAARAWTLLRLN